MDSSIPALVIGAILLLGASFLSRSSIHTYDVLGERVKEVEALAGDQARTRLTVSSATLNAGNDTLTVQVQNDGQTRVATWSAVDVIVNYYTGATSRDSQWLEYASAAPAGGRWTLSAITPDDIEPGILNPGETATLTAVLGTPAASGHTHQVIITTENGVSVTALFSN